MAAYKSYKSHVDHDIKQITRPPFVYPDRLTTKASTTTDIPATSTVSTTINNFGETERSTLLTSTSATIETTTTSYLSTVQPEYEAVLQVVETTHNETLHARKEFTDTFYKENFTVDHYKNASVYDNMTVTDDGDINIEQVFDFMKPPGEDQGNTLLKMSDSSTIAQPDAQHDIAVYILMASILGVLIILTIFIILLYRVYKSKDQYSLTGGKRVKVSRSDTAEVERDDYDLVDFDKDSYRF